MAGRRSTATTSRGPSHSAPYGQACLYCFKAKCRCVSREDGNGCERCHRLQKVCHSSEAIRKRGKAKAAAAGTPSASTANTRVAHIEEKLDSLMSLLQTVTKEPSAALALKEAVKQQSSQTQIQRERAQAQTLHVVDTPVSLSSPATDAAALAMAASPDTPVLFESLSRSSLEMAWTLFHSTFLPFCPFLWLPPDTTAQRLQRHRPFLLRCIVAVTTTLVRDKIAQGRAIKEILAHETLVENKNSMDLLLGLLVYISWGTDPMVSRSGTLSRLVMLALSIVCDMRLNRPLPVDQHMLTTYTTNKGEVETKGSGGRGHVDAGSHMDDRGTEEDDILSADDEALEKQRAVLGCFLITSSISVYFAQIDGMRWTPQMGECLDAVQAHGTSNPLTHHSDAVLAYQVRLQQIVQRAVHSREPAASLPPYITEAFLTNLEELKAAPPQLLAQNDITGAVFVAHIHYVELSLNEMTFSACIPPQPVSVNGTTSPTEDPTARIACYWRSVHAIRGLCDVLLDGVPDHAFGGISFMVWAQLSRAIVTLVRLATIASPELDSHAVRSIVDPLDVLDRFAEHSKSAAAGLGRGLWRGPQLQHDDIYGRVAQLVRVLRAAVAARLESVEPLVNDLNVPPWPMVESVMGQTTGGWGDIWLEGVFPRF
ncbi:hypothetical protein SBRCBS47491_005925 [Sporothrix bragantina]|uniref:Zn(2)-C6 fungal-type domain-containing protein n=1 Tax=Sporothrix bragantina TaxID=671064 RepID=A0ABP0C0Z9_9PEZI